MQLFSLTVPAIVALVLITAAVKKVDIIKEFSTGAMEGLQNALELLPVLMMIVTAISFAYSSGVLAALAETVTPFLSRVGYPGEVIPLALLRPVSGSGAMAVYSSILTEFGPDTFAGRTASVLMGSTETTFYTIAVYFAAVRMKADARVFISSLTADIAGFVFSAIAVRLFY